MKSLAVLAVLAGLGFAAKDAMAEDSTLIVKVNEPDSAVQVLDKTGKVEASQRTDKKGAVMITVEPGKHQLSVRKNGFSPFNKDFEIESGGKKTLTAKLRWPTCRLLRECSSVNCFALIHACRTCRR